MTTLRNLTNEEMLSKWSECSYANLNKFDLSDIHSVMYVQRGETVDDFLSLFNLTGDQLIHSQKQRVNDLLVEVDELMKETNNTLRDFIIDYVLNDTDEETFLIARRDCIEELLMFYETVKRKMEAVAFQCGVA
jgi:dGTP triphosphohydrolase